MLCKTKLKPIFVIILLITAGYTVFAQSFIRVNQLGYTPASIKVAVLVSKENAMISTFDLFNALTDEKAFTSDTIRTFGTWGAFSSSCRLDFSACTVRGAYYIIAGGTRSPVFRISDDVYDGTADFLLQYMRQQRCGYNPFLTGFMPSYMTDMIYIIRT